MDKYLKIANECVPVKRNFNRVTIEKEFIEVEDLVTNEWSNVDAISFDDTFWLYKDNGCFIVETVITEHNYPHEPDWQEPVVLLTTERFYEALNFIVIEGVKLEMDCFRHDMSYEEDYKLEQEWLNNSITD